MKRNVHIIVNKSEITAGTRGASLGPEAVMAAARKVNSTFFGEFPIEYVEDVNHLLDQEEVKYPFAKRIDGLKKVFLNVFRAVNNAFNRGAFPLVLASDHGSAAGTLAGIKATYPDARLGVVWIDAHADVHTPYTTPSGNMHGMPLAMALGEDNKECQRNEIEPHETELWDDLKNMGTAGAKLNAEDLVFIAVRDTEKEEDALITRLNIRNHTVEAIRREGKEVILKRVLEQLKDCDMIYVSFDVDAMDPKETSHGTGTPADNGLSVSEAAFFLTELAKQENVVCMEFVEVNPCLDEKINTMAEVTFELFKTTANILRG